MNLKLFFLITLTFIFSGCAGLTVYDTPNNITGYNVTSLTVGGFTTTNGSITLTNGAGITSNATCLILSSPLGVNVIELCNNQSIHFFTEGVEVGKMNATDTTFYGGIVTNQSITAPSYIGDGSQLTGILFNVSQLNYTLILQNLNTTTAVSNLTNQITNILNQITNINQTLLVTNNNTTQIINLTQITQQLTNLTTQITNINNYQITNITNQITQLTQQLYNTTNFYTLINQTNITQILTTQILQNLTNNYITNITNQITNLTQQLYTINNVYVTNLTKIITQTTQQFIDNSSIYNLINVTNLTQIINNKLFQNIYNVNNVTNVTNIYQITNITELVTQVTNISQTFQNLNITNLYQITNITKQITEITNQITNLTQNYNYINLSNITTFILLKNKVLNNIVRLDSLENRVLNLENLVSNLNNSNNGVTNTIIINNTQIINNTFQIGNISYPTIINNISSGGVLINNNNTLEVRRFRYSDLESYHYVDNEIGGTTSISGLDVSAVQLYDFFENGTYRINYYLELQTETNYDTFDIGVRIDGSNDPFVLTSVEPKDDWKFYTSFDAEYKLDSAYHLIELVILNHDTEILTYRRVRMEIVRVK